MGVWEKLFGGSESKSETTQLSTMTEEQQQVMSQLASYLSNKAGTPATAYGGNLKVGTPAALTSASESLVKLTDIISPTLKQMASGTISAEEDEAFQSGVVNPLLRTLREEILPTVGERFLSTGSFDSSTRAVAEGKAAGDVASQIATKRYEMFQDAQDRVAESATVASNLAGAATAVSGQIYNIDTTNIANAYNDFLRMQDEQNRDFDVWQVNVEGLKLIKDFTLNTGDDPMKDSAYFTHSPIDKKRLKLINTLQ
jgi:hypothetical protein